MLQNSLPGTSSAQAPSSLTALGSFTAHQDILCALSLTPSYHGASIAEAGASGALPVLNIGAVDKSHRRSSSMAPVVSATDAFDITLWQLVLDCCCTDTALCLGYLSSFSQPLRPHVLLHDLLCVEPAAPLSVAVAPASSPKSTGSVAEDSSLNRAARKRIVEVSFAFFARQALITLSGDQSAQNASPAWAGGTPAEWQMYLEQLEQQFSSLHANMALPDGLLIALQSHALLPEELSLTELQRSQSNDGPQAQPSPSSVTSSVQAVEAEVTVQPITALDAPAATISASHLALLAIARYYRHLWSDFRRADFVLSLCPQIDSARFMSDTKYRFDSVLELAHSSDPQNMQIATTLCSRYGISAWEL